MFDDDDDDDDDENNYITFYTQPNPANYGQTLCQRLHLVGIRTHGAVCCTICAVLINAKHKHVSDKENEPA